MNSIDAKEKNERNFFFSTFLAIFSIFNKNILFRIHTDLLIHSRAQILSGEKNVEKYAAYFTKQEEENFALFNYVNELSYEVEVLNEAVQRVQDDIGNHFNCCIFITHTMTAVAVALQRSFILLLLCNFFSFFFFCSAHISNYSENGI